MKIYQILILVLIVVSSACVRNKDGQQLTNAAPSNIKAFDVKEVIQTSSYTYMKVNENSADRWVAVSRMDATKGDKYYYDSALLMNNFHSKELDRDFETIYFINKVSTSPISAEREKATMPSNHSGKTKSTQSSSVTLKKADTEITVAQVFENRSEYANKQIEISGIVVKVNKQVMGKNWIHIQDGTTHNGSFDLTITSQDLPSKGDEVTFKGTIILEKDFGAGYFYDVIMEEGVILKQEKASTQL